MLRRDDRGESRLAPSQWETSLQSNAVSHWLGANLDSALEKWKRPQACLSRSFLVWICPSRKENMTWKWFSHHCPYVIGSHIPTGTRRNNDVIITSKRRGDIVLTSLWRYYCVLCPLGSFTYGFQPQRDSNMESLCFLCCQPDQAVEWSETTWRLCDSVMPDDSSCYNRKSVLINTGSGNGLVPRSVICISRFYICCSQVYDCLEMNDQISSSLTHLDWLTQNSTTRCCCSTILFAIPCQRHFRSICRKQLSTVARELPLDNSHHKCLPLMVGVGSKNIGLGWVMSSHRWYGLLLIIHALGTCTCIWCHNTHMGSSQAKWITECCRLCTFPQQFLIFLSAAHSPINSFWDVDSVTHLYLGFFICEMFAVPSTSY